MQCQGVALGVDVDEDNQRPRNLMLVNGLVSSNTKHGNAHLRQKVS